MGRHSMTVTKAVEGCVYSRRRFYAILLLGGELWHSALCSFSPACPLIQQNIKALVRPRDGQGIRARILRTTALFGQPYSITPTVPTVRSMDDSTRHLHGRFRYFRGKVQLLSQELFVEVCGRQWNLS